MQPHQERVVTEHNDLQDKITKLESFFNTKIHGALDSQEQARLHKQFNVMKQYSDILKQRIAAFV